MDLNVIVTLSDELFDLLDRKLPNLNDRGARRVDKAVQKELGVVARNEMKTTVTVKATPSSGNETTADQEPVSVRIETAPTPEPEQEQAAQESVRVPTIEDCRAAIKAARIRLEGPDYEGKTSEGYTKYHKAISNQVKLSVTAVSGGKCIKVPDLPAECRADFIRDMDNLMVGDDGKLTIKAPF